VAKSKKKSSKKVPKKPEVKPPEFGKNDFQTFYADYTHISYNLAGMRFVFSSISGTEQGRKPYLEGQAAVCMSPEHAVQIYVLLGNHLKEYEEKFGPIRTLTQPKI